jgi:hypothetical protein
MYCFTDCRAAVSERLRNSGARRVRVCFLLALFGGIGQQDVQAAGISSPDAWVAAAYALHVLKIPFGEEDLAVLTAGACWDRAARPPRWAPEPAL